jgi:ubiquinone/menaquinone biosynthesis C-methylase UbiE
MKSKELYPRIFSRHAAAYQSRLDDAMARGEARGRRRVIEFVQARQGMRVLDLACGPGVLSRHIAPLVAPGGEVIGVDLAEGMIDLAREAAIPNARFEVMDMEQLAFPDGSFDAAVCGHGLQFAPDLARAMSEVHRVLRPAGRFAASVPVNSVRERAWTLIEEMADRRLPPPPQATDEQETRAIVEDAEAFPKAAIDAGFSEAAVEVIDELTHWESAEEFVSLLMSWWSFAVRLETVEAEARRAFEAEAVRVVREHYPGVISGTGRTQVLLAVA